MFRFKKEKAKALLIVVYDDVIKQPKIDKMIYEIEVNNV